MSLLDRLSNGWNLLKASFGVILANPRLLMFPAATALLTIVIGFLFLTPIVFQPSAHKYTEGAHWSEVGSRLILISAPDEYDKMRGHKQHTAVSKQAMAYFVIAYFLSMFLATFFNVAFTHEIFDALNGDSVSVGEGIAFALTKIKPILMWTLFAGLIGILIKSLEERFGLFGRWIINLVGFAWSVASVFVIPVLVLEEHSSNPIEVVRQSAGVIRKTWGEALAGYAGLQLGGFLIAFSLFIAVIASGVGAYMTQSAVPIFIGLLGWLITAMVFSYTLGVAGQVYLCVLYRYATAGTVPAGYTAEMLGMAWTPKKV